MPRVRRFDPWQEAPAWGFELNAKLDLILRAVALSGVATGMAIAELEHTMAVNLDGLTGEVERNTSVDESANILLAGLTEEIRKLREGADPAMQAKIDELVNKLKGSTDALAEAVVANTPADPGTPPA